MTKIKIYLLCVICFTISCSPIKHLRDCETNLKTNNNLKFSKFRFQEKLNELGHNSEPWETSNYVGKGILYINNNTFLKQDTLTNSRGKSYFSKTDLRSDILLYLDYGDTDLLPISKELYNEKLINTARYTPTILLNYFLKNKNKCNSKKTANHIVYNLKFGGYSVNLYINRINKLIGKIDYLSYDELYGDITTSFNYSSYIKNTNSMYPSSIKIEKINGKVIDQITIENVGETFSDVGLLEKPINYQLIEKKPQVAPNLKISKFNNYIHFIELEHTDDRVMVVEFENYMLVAEAPLNSKNGELIISEVKKIAPQKPIKYFIFGHHHPHYLGGLRAFVHKGATIICTDISKEYVEYIANSSHSLKADSLHLEHKVLKTQIIKDSLTIGHDKQMKIYFIGEKSAHTKDFLIYYFPNEKLLFQDDLCWISSDGVIKKAGLRQIGLYNSIKELGLDVETIIQSWPVNNHNVKTKILFNELEKSIFLESEKK